METDKIARYVWIGKKDMLWYQRAQDLFTDLFGAERLQLVTMLFAATSINTSLKANITLFRRALHELDNGLPIGNYMPNMRQQLEQIRAGKELTGRKINSFARSMAGDVNAVVVDIWLLRAFGMDKKYFRKDPKDRPAPGEDPDTQNKTPVYNQMGVFEGVVFEGRHSITRPAKLRGLFRSGGASDSQYTKIEKYVRDEAKAMGIEPRQLGAMIWSGVRIDQSGDRETHYERLLRQSFKNIFTE